MSQKIQKLRFDRLRFVENGVVELESKNGKRIARIALDKMEDWALGHLVFELRRYAIKRFKAKKQAIEQQLESAAGAIEGGGA